MQNKNTFIIILLVIVVTVFGYLTFSKSSIFKSNLNPSEFKEYTNSDLGISFQYPAEWGSVNSSIHDVFGNSFEYNLSFSEKQDIAIVGLSYPYEAQGRDGYEADLKEHYLSGKGCSDYTVESLRNTNGDTGNFALAHIVTGIGECDDHIPTYYAIFDVNKKVSNIVIYANPSQVSKTDFMNFAKSVSY